MNVINRRSYYLLLLVFPVVFLLHNINENFGLIGVADLTGLFIIYLIISFCIAFVSRLILKQLPKAFVFASILLIVYFLFGVYKDFAKQVQLPAIINSYKFLLPSLLIFLVLIGYLIQRSGNTYTRLSRAIAVFLVLNIAVETGWCLYNLATRADTRQDFGDYHHEVIEDVKPATGRKPVVFWLVFDEYASSSTLKKVWGFSNPLDSMLKVKGFFVAGSSRSNYNFTHYSLASTLDMVYLSSLANHSIVQLKDLQRGAFSIYDNNVVQVFEKNGYAINNYTIFPLQHHPAQGIRMFDFVPKLMINYQTLGGRMQKDIGWNLPTMFSRNKQAADSLAVVQSMLDLDTSHKNLQSRCMQVIRNSAATSTPSFNMFHFMLPHEPYMYNPDGTVAIKNGYSNEPQHYIPHLQYTNTIIKSITDSIQSLYRQKDVVIILQGDHGFRFLETDPLYDPESCKNLYAVYCSDGDYSSWYDSLSMVNSFRIFFNKYFQAGLPLLRDSSYNLYYR